MLAVPIADESSLQSAVLSYLQEQETMESSFRFSCPHCNRSGTPKKQNKITQFPQVMCIQLRRFYSHFDRESGEPAETTYLQHHVACEETLNIQDVPYRLMAKVYHMGDSLEHGHYYTVCRHNHKDGTWWYYNNTIRRLLREEDENRPDRARVYLCLYERIEDPAQVHVVEDVDDDADGPARGRIVEGGSSSSHL